MAPTDVLHAANTLVGLLGVASANPGAATASGALAALSMSEVWRRLAPQTDASNRLADDLTAELQNHHLPTQIRLLIPQMIAKAALTPAQIMDAGQPDPICTAMLAQLTDPAHKSPKARDGFQRVVTAVLTRYLADPATRGTLRPAFDAAIAAALQHLEQQVDLIAARARDEAQRLNVQDAMLLTLARLYAPGAPASFDAALKSVELALDTVARMNARETAAHSAPEEGQVIAAINQLNALGQLAEADAVLAALPRGIDAGLDALLHNISLDQARLLAAPDRAADRILADLTRQAHPAGQFRSLHDVWEGWYDRGRAQGANFDLNVALHLARVNVDRTKGVQHSQALADLGITQHDLGEQEGRPDRLKQSVASFRAVVAAVKPQSDPEAWADAMTNLGMALAALGARESGTSRLEEAVKTFRAALAVQTRDRVPLDWAVTWGNMGAALTLLADRTDDLPLARQALQQVQEAEAVLRDGGHQTWPADRIPRAQAVIARLS